MPPVLCILFMQYCIIMKKNEQCRTIDGFYEKPSIIVLEFSENCKYTKTIKRIQKVSETKKFVF